MHIVHLLPELNQGGVETIVLGLNRELVKLGHHSTVISNGGKLVGQIEKDGGQHITLDVCSKNPLSVPLRVHQLKTELLKLNLDLLHAHSRVPAWLARLANKKLQIPWVTTVHGFNSVSKYSEIMTKGDRVICVSNPVKEYILQNYPVDESKISVIHCGIAMERFDPERLDQQQIEKLKSEFGLHGKFVATSIGRITELKDYETFIRAIALAHATNPDIRGLIVGNIREDKQDYYDRLQQLVAELKIEKHIHFSTHCTSMPELYALSDVVVSCSKKPESFGLTLIEALAMNTPVIATRHGGPLDIINEGRNGYFFEPRNAEQLAHLLISSNAPKLDLRTDVHKRFSLERMIDSTLSIYNAVTNIIELNNRLFIGEGSHRATYRHPTDGSKCLKVVKLGSLEKRRKNNSKWYKRLRKLSSFDETHKDIQAYRQFGTNESKLKHIPRFYGMVETSRGPAMLLDLIINEDGTPARSLAGHLESGENRDELRNALISLGNHLIKSTIVVRDFTVGDIMVRENRAGKLKLFVIDGLGGTELIPISKIPIFARLKATRRVQRFFEKITQSYPDLALPARRTRLSNRLCFRA